VRRLTRRGSSDGTGAPFSLPPAPPSAAAKACPVVVLVRFIPKTLREAGHVVFHTYDALSAVQLALAIEPINLLLTNTRVAGADFLASIPRLRKIRPTLPIMYLANGGL
jgi:hypothetical protein